MIGHENTLAAFPAGKHFTIGEDLLVHIMSTCSPQEESIEHRDTKQYSFMFRGDRFLLLCTGNGSFLHRTA